MHLLILDSVQFGQPCLLEDVEEQLDYVLEPVLGKQVFKQNQVEYIKVGGELIEYSHDFRLYLTTRLANPHLEVPRRYTTTPVS